MSAEEDLKNKHDELQCNYLLDRWGFWTHDTVLLQFLWADIDSYEMEAPSSILDVIHKLV